jgi:hypothetical protein
MENRTDMTDRHYVNHSSVPSIKWLPGIAAREPLFLTSPQFEVTVAEVAYRRCV